MKLSANQLRWILNAWPPFWGAGIKVEELRDDFSYVRVSLAFRWYNKNYMRVQYGGSLFSMTDPFFVLMLIKRLGKGYVAWDKQSEINYVRPGKGRVYAEFTLSEQQVTEIREAALREEKVYPTFEVAIVDEQKQVVATVKKTLYVRQQKTTDLNQT
ncbi:DUF4442 domain-containing protein [Legionella taurinensis]|uniref:DUF4442 domain-containing protein n=1 Tax=Legionella taurinensis TaxID=70611 RepID=A0A3A5L7K5_9GAMM|nr:DUF4442 domain-containing protein [Legionella taurinensis]MDX1836262.1 DUF4442 domain-containing protein [Legionella taurinensis]PUT41979.1 DUF4442 domain-containing protein [Legionella taurinensis]PUT44768.1 DUF4442 domain-containing protein [Legionella taurinensis]PUT48088.1 DUF4442 domain-containing protein [Legionella taurinensis]PUT48903.1 DUF4442 domain-containing protein [Legionella taurinensis]